jgi:hypothetical protein
MARKIVLFLASFFVALTSRSGSCCLAGLKSHPIVAGLLYGGDAACDQGIYGSVKYGSDLRRSLHTHLNLPRAT